MSVSGKKSVSNIKLSLILSTLISNAEAISCNAGSSDCCWVWRIREIWKLSLTGYSATATSCCIAANGVTCDGPAVIKIVLPSKGIAGPIPVEIGNLKNLQYLNLEGNKLNGTIPTQIGQLTMLTWMSLSKNQLTGSIPTQIGNLNLLTALGLYSNKLSGSIPSTIGNLKSLTTLLLFNNLLTGSIPASIGVLPNLIGSGGFYPFNNSGLNGYFTPNCAMKLSAINTKVTICGCAAKTAPPTIYPPVGTPASCLATGSTRPLSKRIEVFSRVIGTYKFSCNVEGGNPNADCSSTIFTYCADLSTSDRITLCKKVVDDLFLQMAPAWQKVRIECGKWAFQGILGSGKCGIANKDLQITGSYKSYDGQLVSIDDSFINSVNVGLWNNAKLQR